MKKTPILYHTDVSNANQAQAINVKNRPFSADNKMVTVNGYWMDSLTGFEGLDDTTLGNNAYADLLPC